MPACPIQDGGRNWASHSRRSVSAMRGIAATRLRETFAKRKIAKKSRCHFRGASSGREKGSRSAGKILIQPSARGVAAPNKRAIMRNAARRGFRCPKEGRRSSTVQIESDLFRSEVVASDDTALHNEFYFFEHRNALEGIAVHGDDVCVVACFDRASLPG